MSRRFEISFRAELDDRQVDELADTLFELGYDNICFRPLALAPGGALTPAGTSRGCRTEGASTPEAGAKHHSRADSTADRDALRAADQHDLQRLK